VDDILTAIKRAVLARRFAFCDKAAIEMEADGLTELDVAESIVNAVAIYKTGSFAEPLSDVQRISACYRRSKSSGIADLYERQTGCQKRERRVLLFDFIQAIHFRRIADAQDHRLSQLW
jgi:hypothetical protein